MYAIAFSKNEKQYHEKYTCLFCYYPARGLVHCGSVHKKKIVILVMVAASL